MNLEGTDSSDDNLNTTLGAEVRIIVQSLKTKLSLQNGKGNGVMPSSKIGKNKVEGELNKQPKPPDIKIVACPGIGLWMIKS